MPWKPQSDGTRASIFSGRLKRLAETERPGKLAIDRWHGAQAPADTTFLKYVGGLMRPGTAISMPEAELVTLPGFSRDIAASRAEARRLLAEAGVANLAVTLTNRKDSRYPMAQQAISLLPPGAKSACRLLTSC
jgi:hypothetical protein